MPATSFDVPTFHRRSDVVTVLLSTLEEREAAVAEREAEVARRERALECEERMHELQYLGRGHYSSPGPQPAARPVRFEQPMRQRFQQTFHLRELEWWTKQLGYVPVLT